MISTVTKIEKVKRQWKCRTVDQSWFVKVWGIWRSTTTCWRKGHHLGLKGHRLCSQDRKDVFQVILFDGINVVLWLVHERLLLYYRVGALEVTSHCLLNNNRSSLVASHKTIRVVLRKVPTFDMTELLDVRSYSQTITYEYWDSPMTFRYSDWCLQLCQQETLVNSCWFTPTSLPIAFCSFLLSFSENRLIRWTDLNLIIQQYAQFRDAAKPSGLYIV